MVTRARKDNNKRAKAAPPVVLAMDLKQAAGALSLSTRTMQRLAASGELEPVKVGKKNIYSRETLENWLRQKASGGSGG